MAGIGAETGTIEPGKCADFIVTAKNPLEDLRALRQIEMVVAKGRKIDHPQVKRNPVVTAELDKFLVTTRFMTMINAARKMVVPMISG